MLIKPREQRCRNGKCHCSQRRSNSSYLQGKKAVKTIPAALLSVLIAFFPKCPFCWAIYMSMFSSIGLAKLPYLQWLLPVFLLLLGVHLFMLYRNVIRVGSAPLLISVFGMMILLLTRTAFLDVKWMSIVGIIAIISGSLLNALLSASTNKKANRI